MGYVLQLPDPGLQGVQPLVRIDDHVANGDVPAHERIRREEIASRWKVKIGSYLGNLHTGATEGSPGMYMSDLDIFIMEMITDSLLIIQGGKNIVFQNFLLGTRFLNSRGRRNKPNKGTKPMFICVAQALCLVFDPRGSSSNMRIGS